MALFFLSYDLRKSRDYQRMYDELAKYKAVRVLESLWCFNSTSAASALRDHFKGFIDSDDGLVVIQATNWATLNAQGSPNDL
jgi:hypothetical protein